MFRMRSGSDLRPFSHSFITRDVDKGQVRHWNEAFAGNGRMRKGKNGAGFCGLPHLKIEMRGTRICWLF